MKVYTRGEGAELVRYSDNTSKCIYQRSYDDKFCLVKGTTTSKAHRKFTVKSELGLTYDQLNALVDNLSKIGRNDFSNQFCVVYTEEIRGQTRRLIFETSEYGALEVHFQKKQENLPDEDHNVLIDLFHFCHMHNYSIDKVLNDDILNKLCTDLNDHDRDSLMYIIQHEDREHVVSELSSLYDTILSC